MALKSLRLSINSRTIYLASALIGTISGLVAVLFYQAIHLLTDLTYRKLSGIPVFEPGNTEMLQPIWHTPSRLIFIFLPALGGLIVGLLAHYGAHESQGGGTENYLDAFHHKSGILRKRTGFAKFISSAFTLGSGGSGGKEGPMTLIGASVGSLIGKFFSVGARAQRTLLIAGAAGGLGAIFRTPLGGAITAVEVLYKEDFETDALIPSIIASVTAYTTFGYFLGFGHILSFATEPFHSPIQMFFYIALAMICTFAGWGFVRFYRAVEELFTSLPLPSFSKPALGGLIVGLVGIFVPEVTGSGLGIIQQAINGSGSPAWIETAAFFLVLAVLKTVTSGFTIQSGGSAGTLIPSFFIGGMLGGAVGTVFHEFFPEMVPHVTPFIVVGMASFFSAVSNASLGALVMVTEITGGYELLPPLMLVCVISLIFSHKWSLYKNQVTNKFHSKAHLWDMNPAILKNTEISSAFDNLEKEALITPKTTLPQIKTLARCHHEQDFIVVDDNQKLKGILSLHDLEFEDEEDLSGLDQILVAEDLLRPAIWAYPDDHLLKAIETITSSDFTNLPIINREDGRVLGYLTRRDVMRFYTNRQ